MYSRHDSGDDRWLRIEPLPPGRRGGHGGVAADNRRFIDAVRCHRRTGVARRDLPHCFGNFDSLWQRYGRWCRTGVWQRIAAASGDRDTEWLAVDGACAPRPRRPGPEKVDGSGGQAEQAPGRSRGGSGSKIHAAVTPMGQPAAPKLAGGQADDSPHLPGLVSGTDADCVVAGEAHDSGANREAIAAAGAGAVIPPRRNRKEQIPYGKHPYKERHVAERCFGKLKQYRRTATRYDRKAVTFLGSVRLASINIVLA